VPRRYAAQTAKYTERQLQPGMTARWSLGVPADWAGIYSLT
jgi:hypothetical protein